MNVKHFTAVPALTLLAGAALAAGPAPSPALDRFKSLAGEWVAAEDGPMSKKGDLVARYAVTAAGSAVVETVFPGTAHEMLTVYTADGADLVLTHYCMEGNQPRMRAKSPGGAAGGVHLRRRQQHRPAARPPHALGHVRVRGRGRDPQRVDRARAAASPC